MTSFHTLAMSRSRVAGWHAALGLACCCALLPSVSTAAAVISAPSIAENGAVVPVSLKSIDPPVTAGDQVLLIANGALALKTYPTGSLGLTGVSTRVRAVGTSTSLLTVTGKINRHDGTVEVYTADVQITIGAGDVIDDPSYPIEISASDIRVRNDAGETKLLVSDPQYARGYVDIITVTTPAGMVVGDGSACVSRNPYLAFTWDTADTADQVTVTAGSTPSFCTPGEGLATSRPKGIVPVINRLLLEPPAS